jgi:hypothetical protein
MQTPNAFLRSHDSTNHHPTPTPGQAWVAGAVVPAPLPRSVPTLTVYAENDCNLNAEASGLVAKFDGICLRRPPAVRQGRPPQLWELGPGECSSLRSHSGKLSTLRFRAADAPPAGQYLLLPVAGAPERFSLLPC